jgi:nitrous oxidase accessory protein
VPTLMHRSGRVAGNAGGAAGAGGAARAGRLARGASGLLGAVLVAAATLLPLWQTRLLAPQYPGGLRFIAYGHRVDGDVTEIDILNHYVGMRPFDPAAVPEMALWPLAVAVALVAVVVAAWWGRRLVGRLAQAYLWLLPVGLLADIQLRLYQFGHDLDDTAAFRIPEFTPRVVGPTEVLNFSTWSRPGLGWAALVAAAAVATFGPRLLGRLGRGGRSGAAAAVAAAALGILVPLGGPAAALAAPPGPSGQTGDAHDHGGHGPVDAGAPTHRPAPAAPGIPPPVPATGPGDAAAGDLAERLAGAAPGERVILAPGTYRGNVVIDVPIRLEGRDLPLVLGDGTGSVITVRAPGTVITGIAVQGSGAGPVGDPSGIRIEADDVRVEGVVVSDAYTGIAVVGAARTHLVGNTVAGRVDAAVAGEGHAASDDDAGHAPGHETASGTGRSRGDGISLWDAKGVLVRGNHVHDTRDGIYVSFGSGALIDGNHVTGSRYAVHSMFADDLVVVENTFEANLSGAVLMYGDGLLVLRNDISGNRSPSTGFGLLLKDVTGVEAVQNLLVGNQVGLHIDGPTGAGPQDATRIHANTVADNVVGVALFPSARGRFSANSFVGNRVQVLPQGGGQAGRSEWTDRGWGNYWSTYRGYESALPGRGALPHTEGGAVDRLLVRTPVLTALASSPGLQLLRAFEDRWTTRSPVLVDDLPLTRPVSPPVPGRDLVEAQAEVPVTAALAAVVLLLLLLRLRHPRRAVALSAGPEGRFAS